MGIEEAGVAPTGVWRCPHTLSSGIILNNNSTYVVKSMAMNTYCMFFFFSQNQSSNPKDDVITPVFRGLDLEMTH